MPKVSVVIPNYNGFPYLETCLASITRQTLADMEVIVVDNGSVDQSCAYIEAHYPQVRLIRLEKNYGFCRAVNEGIRAARADYVILLNNDTESDPHFARNLLMAIRKDARIFSCASRMINFSDRTKLDDAGNYYCALGWAFARGKGRPVDRYMKTEKIFAACAGAAIYRRDLVLSLGGFDEAHFAYLEDSDIGYRAQIHGYRNIYVPGAVVYHVGSATTGSRYNGFKIRTSARNNLYLLYKNMPALQLLLNAPLVLAGCIIKYLFFLVRGYGASYVKGLAEGIPLCRKNREKRVHPRVAYLPNYLNIQGQLWMNVMKRLRN